MAEATLLSRSVHPSQMTVLAITGSSNDFTVDASKFISPLREGDDLRWANKCAENKYELVK
jgi:hypothetical protein